MHWFSRREEKPLDLDGIVKLISDGRVKNIITLAGAGISTAAGIPDFRSPSSGIYDNLEEFHLPYPMAVFSLNYFQPTLTHHFLRLLHEKQLLRRHYTQDFSACDLLIIMGTSLQVLPFSSLVHRVGRSVPRVYLNREQTEDDSTGFIAFVMRFMVAGFRRRPLKFDENSQDLFVQGNVDDSVLQLAERLGWKDELLAMKKSGDARLAASQTTSIPSEKSIATGSGETSD